MPKVLSSVTVPVTVNVALGSNAKSAPASSVRFPPTVPLPPIAAPSATVTKLVAEVLPLMISVPAVTSNAFMSREPPMTRVPVPCLSILFTPFFVTVPLTVSRLALSLFFQM